MRGRIILTVFWVFSIMLAGGDAQILRIGPAHKPRPVWTMEVIKVKAGELGATLDYLDEHWSRVREEAKREGVLLSYHRIADQAGAGANTHQTIVLLTEYKDQATYREREKLFSSIAKSQNLPLVWSLRGNPGMMLDQRADLFESLSTSVYNDYTDSDENVRIVRFQAVY